MYPDTITMMVMPASDMTYYVRDSVPLTGCVDTAVIIVTVKMPAMGTETYEGCEGDGYSVTVDGMVYNEMNPTGIDTTAVSICHINSKS